MKKRFLAMMCVLTMSFSIVACGSNDEVKEFPAEVEETLEEAEEEISEEADDLIEEIEAAAEAVEEAVAEETEEETAEAEEDSPISKALGTVADYSYENEFFNFGVKLDDSWTFLDAEQILATKEETANLVGDEYKEYLTSTSYISDFMAVNENQTDTVNLAVEKLPIAYITLSEEEYLSIAKESLTGALESMGISNISLEDKTVTIGTETHPSILVVGEYAGVEVYEEIVAIKKNNFVASLTVCYWVEDHTEEFFDTHMYAIK